MIVGGVTTTFPRVEIVAGGKPVTIENAPLWQILESARVRGLGIDVWTVTPWDTVVQGVDSGDSPSAWVFRWQTIAPVSISPTGVFDVSNGPLYLRVQNPSRDYTTNQVGLGEPFFCINPDLSSYQVGGAESNGSFLRGFARGATIWAAVVATTVATVGAVSDFGLSGTVTQTTAAGVVETAPALVGPVETTVGTGWSFTEVVPAAKAVIAEAKPVLAAVSAVKTAVQTAVAVAQGKPVPAPVQSGTQTSSSTGDNAPMLAVAAIAALFLIG